MNRRHVLAAGALALSGPLAGCLDSSGTAVRPAGSTATPPEDCGPAAQPLPERLGDNSGDPAPCFEDATPSLVVANERDDSVSVDVDIESFTDTFSLAPGERVVESSAFEAQDEVTGTVTVEDETWDVEWPERSCYRHGIALGETPEVGWVEPLRGPGDTQHDCYPGTSVPLRVGSTGEARRVSVTVTDECTGDRSERTVTLAAGTSERLDGLLESGGRFSVEIDVEDGPEETDTFNDGCWGLVAGIRDDGTIRIDEIGID